MSHSSAAVPPQGGSSTVANPNAMADDLLAVGGAVPFDKTSPEQENVFHTYTGNAIPWIIRGIWIAFWCFAITYFVVYLLPALQSELLSPP
ncbi:hypothetical protein [Aquisphaera insulae]|uniref:hypothetical protein n=1 Tax=Aquisphaera insulae TaxID=2712864 RepID=UPI0013ED552E|nr:hypothetical protein [Aquisphaera insulae]